MRYVRFMSYDELEKYMRGVKLVNNTDWRKKAQCTDSIGFCFFDDSKEPEERLEYLTGVVTMDCVAVFERISNKPMRKSKGRYRDPDKDIDIFKPVPVMMTVDEYSVKSYSMEDMRPVRVGVVVDPYFDKRIEWL